MYMFNSVFPMPPPEMRRLVGPIEESAFENHTGQPVLDVPPEYFDNVLDFGCGCGRLARQMLYQKPRPKYYTGFDLHPGMIKWCQENITPRAPEFTFVHHDVSNNSFNAGSEGRPFLLSMPAPDRSISLITAVSVWTHTIESHADYYLNEVARVLRSDGMLAATFFLFDKQYFPMMQEFQNALYINIDDPWNAVIFDRSWLEQRLSALGLRIVRAVPPTVRGFQWLLYIRRASAGQSSVALGEDLMPFGRVPPPS